MRKREKPRGYGLNDKALAAGGTESLPSSSSSEGTGGRKVNWHKYVWVTQLHSVLSVPQCWRPPTGLLVHYSTHSFINGPSSGICPKPVTSEPDFDEWVLAESCCSAYLHPWRQIKGFMESRESTAIWDHQPIQSFIIPNCVFRIVSPMGSNDCFVSEWVVEVDLPDGSLLRSEETSSSPCAHQSTCNSRNDFNDGHVLSPTVFTHFSFNKSLQNVKSVTISLSNPPPKVPGQSYDLVHIGKQACDLLSSVNRSMMSGFEPKKSCVKTMSAEIDLEQAYLYLESARSGYTDLNSVFNPNTPLSTHRLSGPYVTDQAQVEGVGEFWSFSTGRIRVAFCDGVFLDMKLSQYSYPDSSEGGEDTARSGFSGITSVADLPVGLARMLMKDGTYQFVNISNPPPQFTRYLLAAGEWMQWVKCPEEKRESVFTSDNRILQHMIQSELDKIKCFNFMKKTATRFPLLRPDPVGGPSEQSNCNLDGDDTTVVDVESITFVDSDRTYSKSDFLGGAKDRSADSPALSRKPQEKTTNSFGKMERPERRYLQFTQILSEPKSTSGDWKNRYCGPNFADGKGFEGAVEGEHIESNSETRTGKRADDLKTNFGDSSCDIESDNSSKNSVKTSEKSVVEATKNDILDLPIGSVNKVAEKSLNCNSVNAKKQPELEISFDTETSVKQASTTSSFPSQNPSKNKSGQVSKTSSMKSSGKKVQSAQNYKQSELQNDIQKILQKTRKDLDLYESLCHKLPGSQSPEKSESEASCSKSKKELKTESTRAVLKLDDSVKLNCEMHVVPPPCEFADEKKESRSCKDLTGLSIISRPKSPPYVKVDCSSDRVTESPPRSPPGARYVRDAMSSLTEDNNDTNNRSTLQKENSSTEAAFQKPHASSSSTEVNSTKDRLSVCSKDSSSKSCLKGNRNTNNRDFAVVSTADTFDKCEVLNSVHYRLTKNTADSSSKNGRESSLSPKVRPNSGTSCSFRTASSVDTAQDIDKFIQENSTGLEVQFDFASVTDALFKTQQAIKTIEDMLGNKEERSLSNDENDESFREEETENEKD
ncbi:uncharacterized protein LOC134847525 isoform X2 [Symsagittifera roscoffensis]|uniref:uncharacterized protein LOC134847525 isoform X2 n=1 Tax=Symsagittifera roscoffensis TaxID=84072 RepID=UPI00307B18B2